MSGVCQHTGTVWSVDVIDQAHDPARPLWECTRCGEQWKRRPTIPTQRRHSWRGGRHATELVTVGGSWSNDASRDYA